MAQSSWVPLVHCDHSDRKVLLRNRHSNNSLPSHRGRAVTIEERDVERENEGRRNVSDRPFSVELACLYPSIFVTVEHCVPSSE